MSVKRLALSSAPVDPLSRTPSSGETSKPKPERPVAAKSLTFGARKPRLTLPVRLMWRIDGERKPGIESYVVKVLFDVRHCRSASRIERIVD